MLDRFNYAINKTNLVSSGQEFGRNENLGNSNFHGFDNINDFNNVSALVSSTAENHRGYQHAQRMGGPSEGPFQGNPRFGNYHKQNQNNHFHDTNLRDIHPPDVRVECLIYMH